MKSTAQSEDALAAFVKSLPDAPGTAARSLANAWRSGGGRLAVGQVAVRLLGGKDGAFTAATIHHAGPRLEICRAILAHHGVDADAWTHWSDQFLDLAPHGFDPVHKYPSIALSGTTPTELARLVTGVRDLAHLVTS